MTAGYRVMGYSENGLSKFETRIGRLLGRLIVKLN